MKFLIAFFTPFFSFFIMLFWAGMFGDTIGESGLMIEEFYASICITLFLIFLYFIPLKRK